MEKIQVIQPTKLLAPYIKQYWLLRIDDVKQGFQRSIPAGCVALVFHKGNKIISSFHKGTQPQQKEPQPIQDKCQEPKIISHIAETENPFKSILNDRQIALLVDCINEVEIFNAPMTFEDLKAILSCKPKVIFRSNNNRQVAFLFSELSNRGLITPNWQSVIAKNKLFVTKNIKKDKYLNQGDLATAANYVKGVEHEKDYVTISNYIKQLKKL